MKLFRAVSTENGAAVAWYQAVDALADRLVSYGTDVADSLKHLINLDEPEYAVACTSDPAASDAWQSMEDVQVSAAQLPIGPVDSAIVLHFDCPIKVYRYAVAGQFAKVGVRYATRDAPHDSRGLDRHTPITTKLGSQIALAPCTLSDVVRLEWRLTPGSAGVCALFGIVLQCQPVSSAPPTAPLPGGMSAPVHPSAASASRVNAASSAAVPAGQPSRPAPGVAGPPAGLLLMAQQSLAAVPQLLAGQQRIMSTLARIEQALSRQDARIAAVEATLELPREPQA